VSNLAVVIAIAVCAYLVGRIHENEYMTRRLSRARGN
jgi:hypothetical protein